MKVGIITRHAVANYGSILQAYATENVLKKMGYEAEIINYIREDEKTDNQVETYANSSKVFGKNKLTKKAYKILQGKNIKNMDLKFEEFRKKYLTLTEECNSTEDLRKLIEKYDIFCTGSDQVWGKIGNDEFDKNYFLDFVNNKKKCISYAASFGKTDLTNELMSSIKSLTEKYHYILVRENSAKKFLKENNINKVEQVLDPTLLLERKDWESIIDSNYKKAKQPYIFVYQLHHNKEFEKYVKYIHKKLKIPVYRVNPSIYYAFKPGKFIYLPSPSEFLFLIKNAEYVLTDSFHGTVFSLLFNKKFVDFLPQTTSTRITSLLNLIKLEERVISDYKSSSVLYKDIDYTLVNEIINNERKKSLEMLKGALNEK